MSEKKGIFDWYFKSNLLFRIGIGLILGAVLGIILAAACPPETVAKVNGYLKPFGDAFIKLLKMIIVPTILFTLVVGASSISVTKLGKVGVKIFVYYLVTTAFAVIIGLCVAFISKPGAGLDFAAAAGKDLQATQTTLSQIILGMIPDNFFDALAKASVLQIIFFALLFGIAIAILKESSDDKIKSTASAVFNIFSGMAEAMYIIIRWVMQYAPIGVFALMVGVFAIHGAKVAGPLLKVTIVVYAALILHTFITYGSILRFTGLGIFGFLKRARDPMVTAFVTRSSSGTLPITLKNAENMGISKGVYSFTLPIGATINMDGTAIYQAVCFIFVANAVGHVLTVGQMVTVVLTVVLASIGTAGVPGAGVIMLIMVLEAVGLKIEGNVAQVYAMILGIDAILDMGRTCLNVGGDTVGAVVVAKSEGELDMAKYNAFDGRTV